MMSLMKKIFNILTIVAGAALMLVSCAKQEIDTNQFPATSEVVLKAYGPRPVVRGGVLRFVGANLDQVASVTIPGCSPITDIEVVTSGVPSEIRVTVPKEEAEPGTVILTTKGGKTIETPTPLSYIETIVLDKVTPESAYPGEVITLEGDYLNLIHEVIFTNKLYISEKDFISRDRYSVKVKVPAEARTGKVGVGTIDENVETDEDLLASLNVLELDFTVKTAEGTVSGEYKAGETVAINGTKLSLVKSLELEGATVTDFSATDSKITFTLPDTATDGAVLMVMASGVEVSAGNITTKVPVVSGVTPSPVKNGATITLVGSDLDLVTGLDFQNSTAADFAFADGKITATVTEAAQEGEIVLHLANGKTVTADLTLVRPVITAYSANPASAGSEMTITGTDLDLVAAVTFGGDIKVDVKADETSITVSVPTAAENGVLVMNLKNGENVDGLELAIDKPAGAYIAVMPETLYKPGEMFIVDIENPDHLTGVQVDGEDVNFILSASTLYFQIPASAKADSQLTLVSDNGSVTYTMNIDPGDFIVTPIWTGSFVCDGWNGNQELAWGGYDWSSVKPGMILRFELESTVAADAWWCISLRHGDNWGNIPGLPGQYDTPESPLDVVLTADILADLVANGGLVLTGTGYKLSQVSLVQDLRYGDAIWEGMFECSGWNGNQELAWGGYDWSSVKPGQTLFFFMESTVAEGDWWCISLRHGDNWVNIPGLPGQYDSPAESPMGVTLTADIIADLVANGGLVITGTGYNLSKVSLK